MLDFFKKITRSREGRHGITVYLIFGTIILVFAFWGVKTVDTPQAGYAAEVNHEIVTVGEFKRAFDRQLQFYGQFMGGQFTPKGEQLVRMKEGVLEQLIGSKLISQAAEKSGFKATDGEIRDQIYSIPAFQQNGRFDRGIYKAYLEQSRLSPSEFENNLRESARMNLVRSVMTSVLKPSDSEAKKLYTLQNTKVSVDFLKLSPSSATDAEIANYLKIPEHMAKATSHYNNNKSKYTQPEQIRASHILIKTVPGKEAEAQKKIEAIAQRAKTEDFAKLAKEFTEDVASKSTNGDLGYFSRSRMVEEFENAAFSLEPGKISAPVKTNFGYHLIKVVDKKAGHTQSLDEVKNEIARDLLNEEKSTQFYGDIEKTLKSGQVNDLNKVASIQKFKWENTGLFDLSAATVPKLGSLPELSDLVAGLTKEKPLAQRLIRQGNFAYVIRLKERQSAKVLPSTKDLESVSQQVASSRLGEVFDVWQENLTRSSTIRRNELVFGDF